MQNPVRVGIIGDFDPAREAHVATVNALQHAADQLSAKVNITWIPTTSIPSANGPGELQSFDGLWAAPVTPKNPDGAIAGIRVARESNIPFFGT